LKKKKDRKSFEKKGLLKLVHEIEVRKLELIIFLRIELQTIELDKIFLEFL
jgi:hypothetical protein